MRSKLRKLLAQTISNSQPSWLIHLDTIDSTNNYAMKLIDDGMAQHGQVVWANHQSNGKGQRGKHWNSDAENLMMSLIVSPRIAIEKQFAISMQIAITIATYLKTIFTEWQIAIKWPNDIFINDKKACGILIENVFRGTQWANSVIGIGLNVNQKDFPEHLPHATSMYQHLQKHSDIYEIVCDLRSGILNKLNVYSDATFTHLLTAYNHLMYKKNEHLDFEEVATGRVFTAFVQEVNENGQLVLLTHKGIEIFSFGTINWLL